MKRPTGRFFTVVFTCLVLTTSASKREELVPKTTKAATASPQTNNRLDAAMAAWAVSLETDERRGRRRATVNEELGKLRHVELEPATVYDFWVAET